MSGLSEDEIIQTVNGFLLNAPPGEFMEVVTDVRGLLKNDGLLNNTAPETFKKYNTEQMLQVQSPAGDHKVLITQFGEVGDGEYLDPKGGKVIQFDHIKQEVSGSRNIGGELDDSIESTRKQFEDEAFKYVAEYYENGSATVYGKGGKVIICISASIFNPSNFWNGRWRSVWTCTIKGNDCELNGNIRINVHYYEDGNVQLVTDTNKKKTVPSKAAAALKAIGEIEAKFHQSLNNSYHKMGDTTFKALRRQLPITRQKIDWNKIASYKLGQDMSK